MANLKYVLRLYPALAMVMMTCCGCAILFAGAFSTLLHDPIQRSEWPSKTFVIDAPREKVIQASLAVMQAEGYQIEAHDSAQGLIETARKPMTAGAFRFLSGAITGAKGFSEVWIIEVAQANEYAEITLRAMVFGDFVMGKPTYESSLAKTVLEYKVDTLARSIAAQAEK